ncbi:ABC transporter E family member 2 [Tanacetum coccineum]
MLYFQPFFCSCIIINKLNVISHSTIIPGRPKPFQVIKSIPLISVEDHVDPDVNDEATKMNPWLQNNSDILLKVKATHDNTNQATLNRMYLKPDLSDAELQKVALALCLANARCCIYLLDEPTKHFNSEECAFVSQVIKSFIQLTRKTAFVVERDVTAARYLTDKVIVFQGAPFVACVARAPICRN